MVVFIMTWRYHTSQTVLHQGQAFLCLTGHRSDGAIAYATSHPENVRDIIRHLNKFLDYPILPGDLQAFGRSAIMKSPNVIEFTKKEIPCLAGKP
jgi:hypothetical protein